ncbi:MAG: ImmA/IrrE family metallo-endopeptidase [Pirellulaceae bacterium]|nr:ImmA/IrrE family metallo-endopeptidase [Pirellulaceae bacterium]
MIRSRSWTLGNIKNFAIALSFDEDPENGRGASLEQAATWGSFEIWVNGLNLCRHQELNHSLDKVNWYVLPLLRWLIDNWDYLLHEERLPNKNQDRDAWLSFRHTASPPLALGEEQSDIWEENFQAWWSRHSLLACRDGGLFPNLFIRRFRDFIEFSWGPSPIAGKPEHYQFFAAHGYARIEAQLVVDQLEGLLDSATQHLRNEIPNSKVFERLRQDFESLRSDDRNYQRLGLMAGFSDNGQTAGQSYRSHTQEFVDQGIDSTYAFFMDGEYTDTFIREAPQVCLMFGSVSPHISRQDVERISKVVIGAHGKAVESQKLRQMTRDIPIRSALEYPWDKGYELAESFHEAFANEFVNEVSVDIERVVRELEITVSDIALDDRTIRAIAIAGEGFEPMIAINSQYKYQERYPRRFTLAHELCHLLHDRTHGMRLALASGPWAPVDIEKRANAFAAMFLMPRNLIELVIQKNNLQVDSIPCVWQFCELLLVSFSAAVEHLCNLGYIDEVTRDAMKLQVIESNAPSAYNP